MPRQQMHHRRGFYEFPKDFAECVKRYIKASGLSVSERARRLGTSPVTVRRWSKGFQPTFDYLLALKDLAEDLGLSHLESDSSGNIQVNPIALCWTAHFAGPPARCGRKEQPDYSWPTAYYDRCLCGYQRGPFRFFLNRINPLSGSMLFRRLYASSIQPATVSGESFHL